MNQNILDAYLLFFCLFFFPLEGFAPCFPGNHAWSKGKDLFCGKGIHF